MAPIELKELEEHGKEVGTTNRESRVSAVVNFLKGHTGQAYTQTEIGKAVGIGSTHANQILRNLCEKKTVIRKRVTVEGGKQLIHYAIPVPKKAEK